MSLYRPQVDFFLNDFRLTLFYGKNRPENHISGLEAARYFQLSADKQAVYVFCGKALTFAKQFNSAGLSFSAYLDSHVFQH